MALKISAQKRCVALLFIFLILLPKASQMAIPGIDRSGKYNPSEKECVLVNGNSWAPLLRVDFGFLQDSFSEESGEYPDPPVDKLAYFSFIHPAVVYWTPVLDPGHTVVNQS